MQTMAKIGQTGMSFDEIFAPLNDGIRLCNIGVARNKLNVACLYNGQKRNFSLPRPVQYQELTRFIEKYYGKYLSMEGTFCKNEEVYVRLSSQTDLDAIVQLIDRNSQLPDLRIRLFMEDVFHEEPHNTDATTDVHIRSPEFPFVAPSLHRSESPPPGVLPELMRRGRIGSLSRFIPDENDSSYGSFPSPPSKKRFEGFIADDEDDDGSQVNDRLPTTAQVKPFEMTERSNSFPFRFKNSTHPGGLSFQHSISVPNKLRDLRPVAANTPSVPINWEKGRHLGSGNFGQVYICHDKDTGRDLAVKQVTVYGSDTTSPQMEALQIELQLLQKLHHPHIVEFYGSQFDNGTLSLFMEFVPGGSIRDQIDHYGPLTEVLTRRYTRQVLCGLSYLHQNNITHRDIKGANLLRDHSGIVKLGDFGSSKQLSTVTKMNSLCGTYYYMSPELIDGRGYGRNTDVWSLGCTVVEMLTSFPPWHEFEGVAAIYRIATADHQKYDLPSEATAAARDFLTLCFIRDAKKRPSADILLRHSFVSDAVS